MKPFLLFIVCLILGTVCFIQNVSAQDLTLYQLWADYYRYYNKTEKVKIYSDYGVRFLLAGDAWGQINVRPSMRYRWKESLELRGQMGTFFTFEETGNSLELRPSQSIVWRWPNTPVLKGRQRAMLEERLFTQFESGSVSFAPRLRIRPLVYVYFKPRATSDFWYSIIRTEFFSDLNLSLIDEQFRNRSRIQLGLGYQQDIKWRYEFYVTYEDNRSNTENPNPDKIMFQIRVKQQLFKN